MQVLTIALLVGGLFFFFAIGMYLNNKTPLPEGIDYPSMRCDACSENGCPSNPNKLADLKAEIKNSIKNESERVE